MTESRVKTTLVLQFLNYYFSLGNEFYSTKEMFCRPLTPCNKAESLTLPA